MCRSTAMFNSSIPRLIFGATVLAAVSLAVHWPEEVRAASVFENEVWANGASGYTICNLCDIQAPISPFVPNTIFHPNPINGYGSIQGVDVGPQNGLGLTVNAAVDLPLGSTVAGSTSTAYVEFTIDPPNPINNDPVDVLIRGAYGYTEGAGAVQASLWKGMRNGETPTGVLMQSGLGEPSMGIWEGNVQLLPYTTYTLKLQAEAYAIDNSSLFIPSGRAFIDPVISAASGSPLTINFDAGTLTNNPNFISPTLVPEPSALAFLGIGALGMAGRRRRKQST